MLSQIEMLSSFGLKVVRTVRDASPKRCTQSVASSNKVTSRFWKTTFLSTMNHRGNPVPTEYLSFSLLRPLHDPSFPVTVVDVNQYVSRHDYIDASFWITRMNNAHQGGNLACYFPVKRKLLSNICYVVGSIQKPEKAAFDV